MLPISNFSTLEEFFSSKNDENSFSKTSSFQNKIFLHKNVFFPNLSFKNKIRLIFFFFKFLFKLAHSCCLKTFLRIAYYGFAPMVQFLWTNRHQLSLHSPSHFFGTNTFLLSYFLHGKNENTWWMTTRCYLSNTFFLFFNVVIYYCIVFNIHMLDM